MIESEQQGNATGDSGQWRVSLFNYDSLSRLTSTVIPESGTTTFAYDDNGNLQSRTDARGANVGFQYDALNRLTYKSDGVHVAGYAYDDANRWGQQLFNSKGRLTLQTMYINNVLSSASIYSYDPMGRVKQQTTCLPPSCGVNYPVSAEYDVAGEMTSLTYPSTRKITQDFSTAGRVQDVTFAAYNGATVNFPYVSMPTGTNPDTWGYWPSGALHLANSSTPVHDWQYLNNRMQPISLQVNSGKDALLEGPGLDRQRQSQ